ncbi:MAG: helix-turn-helix domain-containing protein [Chloroflexi bacterium]|nr:helix-turn-helix domain-containing protein [Chloroflexota bacterium]
MATRSPKQLAEQHIKTLEARGFSQYEIARRAGISRGHVYNVLRGRAGLSRDTAAKVLGNLDRDFKAALAREYGIAWVDPANSRQYSILGKNWNAIQRARETGDRAPLREFRRKHAVIVEKGKRVKIKLLDDRDWEALKRLEEAGQLDPQEVTRGGSQPSPRAAWKG